MDWAAPADGGGDVGAAAGVDEGGAGIAQRAAVHEAGGDLGGPGVRVGPAVRGGGGGRGVGFVPGVGPGGQNPMGVGESYESRKKSRITEIKNYFKFRLLYTLIKSKLTVNRIKNNVNVIF